MKKFLIGLCVVLGAVGICLTVVAARFEPTIRPNTQIGIVPVGGLTKADAAKKLRIWWESAKLQDLELVSSQIRNTLPKMSPGKLGISLDDAKSVDQCEMADFWDTAQSKISGGDSDKKQLEVKFKTNPANLSALKSLIKSAIGSSRPARVTYAAGMIIREPEVTSFELDDEGLSEAVVSALGSDGKVEVPIHEAPKHVSDADLQKVTDVVSEFSTHFPSYQTSRNTNIRLAAAKLSGHVLMPGDQISFNETVGRRTIEDGYRLAPVLKMGKHDVGIGGGICQVSTTLYNASLLADLKIVKRNNHSIPSVYVPVGRDATVDYGSLDLVIQNSMDTPIAINSEFQNGKIIFRVLGKKDPSKLVKITTGGHSAWGNGVKTVIDRSLPPGKTKVVEKGSAGHAITTYRTVYENGVEIKRETLNHSVYRGSPRIIAINNAPRQVKKIETPGVIPPTPPDQTPPPTTTPDTPGR
jgi:vancomycin resistance protein YoaR